MPQTKPAILSKTLHFLTAGGITLVASMVQEIARPQTDWGVVATTAAGLLITVVGGGYGRVVAQGPLTSLKGPPRIP